MKMIFQHNPHLGKGDEGMVWQRMQQALRVHEAQIAGKWFNYVGLEIKGCSYEEIDSRGAVTSLVVSFFHQRKLCKNSSNSSTWWSKCVCVKWKMPEWRRKREKERRSTTKRCTTCSDPTTREGKVGCGILIVAQWDENFCNLCLYLSIYASARSLARICQLLAHSWEMMNNFQRRVHTRMLTDDISAHGAAYKF